MSERRLIVNPCTVDVGDSRAPADGVELFIEIRLDNDGELHITGVEGPKRNGDAWGSCGQIDMHEWRIVKMHRPWDEADISALRLLWKRWHLNHMKAGSPAQEEHLRSLAAGGVEPWRDGDERWTGRYGGDHFAWAKIVLAEAGLQPDPAFDPPYSYGSAWMREDVPEHVLDWLFALPPTTKEPAWV